MITQNSDEEGDLANIIFSDIEEPEYSNNLTVFERFLGSETESNGETYFNPMPVEAPQSGVQVWILRQKFYLEKRFRIFLLI